MSEKDLQTYAQTQGQTAPNGAALTQAMAYGVQQNPDEYARALRLARKVGVSPAIVNPQVEQAVNSSDATAAVSQSPNVAAWFSHPDNAAVAHDDTGALSTLGNIFHAGLSFIDPFDVRHNPVDAWKGTFYGAKSGFQSATGGLLDFAGRGEDYLATLGSAMRKQFSGQPMTPQEMAAFSTMNSGQNPGAGPAVALLSSINPSAMKADAAEARGAAQQLLSVDAPASEAQAPQTLTGKAFSAAGGIVPFLNPLAPVMMAAQGYGSGESEAQVHGADESSQVLSGLGQGAIMGTLGKAGELTEASLPYLKPLLSKTNPALWKALTQEVGAGIEGPASRFTTQLLLGGTKTGVEFSAMGAGNRAMSEAANPNGGDPLSAALNPKAAAKDFGQGVLFHAVPTLGGSALDRAFEIYNGHQAVAKNQAFLNALAEGAQGSKLAKRLPPAFQEFVEQATANGPIQSVQIEPSKLVTLFQDHKIDPATAAAELKIPNLDEALASGTDVKIPIADFTSKIATQPELFNAMLPDLRFAPGEPTAADLSKPEPVTKASPEVQAEAAQVDAESKDSAFANIQTDMQARLLAAGRSPGEAEAGAKVWASQMLALSKRGEGWTPQELHDFYAPTITTPGLEERAGTPLAIRAVDRLAAAQDGLPSDGLAQDEPPIFYQSAHVEAMKARVHSEAEAALADEPSTLGRYAADPRTDGGKIINGDVMAEVASPSVAGNPILGHSMMAEHGAASRLANDAFEQRMAEPPKSPDETVLILVGNAGAGKSTVAKLNSEHYQTVLDTNAADPEGLKQNINRALDSGRKVDVVYVHAPIEEAVRRNITRQEKEGRPVSIKDQADLAVKTPASFTQAHDVFGMNPDVAFGAGGNTSSGERVNHIGQDARDFVDSIRQENGASSLLDRAISAYTSKRGEGHATPEVKRAFDAARSIFESGVEDRLSASPGDHGELGPDGFEGAGTGSGAGEASTLPGAPGSRLEQGSKPLEFGSKAWKEYYRQNKGSLTPKGEPAAGSGGKEKARQFKTKKGQEAFDNAMADSALAEKRAYEEYRRQFAEFDRQVKGVQAGDIYSKGTRGFVQFDADGKPQIGFMNADPSTFFHETGHITLEMLGDLASKEGASEGLKSDYQGILDWLGAKDRQSVTVEQHEKFARGIEQYLREGKAPSEGLRPVFQRIKYWLMGVYRHARELKVQLNPEIRGIMDRLFASEAEIEQARKTMGDGGGLFATAKDMGVSDEMFQKYREAIQNKVATAKDKMVAELAKEDAREKTAWWKDELAKTKEQVAAEVDADPRYQAFKALTKGATDEGTPIKLDKADLVNRYGEAVLKELPPTFGHLYTTEGMDADTAAEVLGFRSADDLINGLRDLEPRKARIDRLADLQMKAKHGDMLNDGSSQDAALEAMHDQKRADVLHMELKALNAKRAEVEPFVKQALKEAQKPRVEVPKLDEFKAAAKGFIERTAIKDLEPYRYLVAERAQSRAAFEAVQKGKPDEALEAKRKELLNHFLYREAVKAKEEADKIQAYAKKVSGDAYRAKLGLAGERAGTDFLAQHDNILDRFDFRRRTNKELEQKRQSLSEWVAKMTAEGETPAITDELLNENYRKNYREMTIPELQAVRDALVNIGHLASEVNKVTIDGKKIEKDLVVSKMAAALMKNEGVNHPIPFDPNLKKSLGEKTGNLGRGIDALLIRMEQMFKWADNGDVNGIFHKAIWDPIQRAHEELGDLSREATKKIQDAMDTMPKEMRQKMQDTVDVEGMPSGTLTRKSILTMLLNMGNDSNFEKLTKGYGISPDAVFKAVGRLTKEEVQWAQGIWDTVGSLRPKIGDLERRTTGLEPKWVDARPFTVTLQNGEQVKLDGGYFPVKYDPRVSTVGERQLTGDVSELTDKGFSRPSTPNGFTKERTRFVGPLELDYEKVLLPHLSAVLKDLSHREAVKQAYQLITNDQVRKAFTEAFGKEYTDQLLPWLKTIVNDSNGATMKGLGLLDSGARGIRRNTVAAAMGFRIRTALVQYTGITRSLHEVGTLPFARAYTEFMSNPKKSFAWINEVSGEMRNRAQNLDRDFREVHNRAVAGDLKGIKAQAAELAFHGLHLTDIAISYPTWLGRFRQSLAQGKDQATAIKEADQAVRMTQPTAGPKDLPAIMRNNETGKLLTMFYGHFNLLYQNIRDTGHFITDSKNPINERAMKAAKTALVSIIIPGIAESIFSGSGPKKDESYAEWIFLKSLHFASASVPLLRELGTGIVDTLEGKRPDMKFSPMLETMSKAGGAVYDTKQAVTGEGDSTKAVMSDLDAAGYLTGIPGTGQIMTTARYIRGRATGRIPSEGVFDTIHHAAVGYPNGGKK